MPFEDSKSHLRDIWQSINFIEEFVLGMDLDAYRQDARTQAAVERKMLVISEAAVRLGNDAETLCPAVPWRDIRGIGNWLRHQYDRVNAETVWNTITDDLPPLKAAVEKVLGPRALDRRRNSISGRLDCHGYMPQVYEQAAAFQQQAFT